MNYARRCFKYIAVFFIALTFFVLAFITLSDYGINWDEPLHFNRGQAYLRFYLTGKKDYLDIPSYPKSNGDSDYMGREGEQDIYLSSKSSSILPKPSYKRSYYQSDVFNYGYFIKNDGYGHPPTNDILAAIFNNIFYHKLGILGDIESYHLFEVTLSSFLVLGIGFFVLYCFGILASVVATISLAVYPLFFAESHFNIKDPPEASLFSLAIIAFYFGIVKDKISLLVFSAVLVGLALGTKFNAIFIPFIILPWLVVHFVQKKEKPNFKILFSLPFIVLIVFYIFWPYLWQNPVGGLLQIIKFYQDSGTAPTGELVNYIKGGFDFFPTLWIGLTTPIPILIFSLIGIAVSFLRLKKGQLVYLLILAWFLFPIIRVTLPGTAIHSGVRHIMEFIPAMAILSGLGASFIYSKAHKRIKPFILLTIIAAFVFVIWENVKIHPNENVYFNQIIGGLPGAKAKDIPYWGYNYGNVYFQGVGWMNDNAALNAKLALPIVNMVNVPRIKLRPDISFSNAYLSGSNFQGEYVMEASNNWRPESWYAYAFYDKYLDPVYEVKVDDVTLLKIWKNDRQYLKNPIGQERQEKIKTFIINNGTLNIDMGKEILLSKVVIEHSNDSCDKQKGGYIKLSLDGKTWVQESEGIDYPQIPIKWLGNDKNTFVFLVIGKASRYIFLDTQMKNSCILNSPEIRIFRLSP